MMLMTESSASKVRFQVLGITTLAAFLMYLDRACIGWIINAESFQSMGLSSTQKDHVASAFFWGLRAGADARRLAERSLWRTRANDHLHRLLVAVHRGDQLLHWLYDAHDRPSRHRLGRSRSLSREQ